MKILHLLVNRALPKTLDELDSNVLWLAALQASEGHDVTVATMGHPSFVAPLMATHETAEPLPHGFGVMTGPLHGTRAELQVFLAPSTEQERVPQLLGELVAAFAAIRSHGYDLVHLHQAEAVEALPYLAGTPKVVATDWRQEQWEEQRLDALVDPAGQRGTYIPWITDPRHHNPLLDLDLPSQYDRNSLGRKKHSRMKLRATLNLMGTDDPPIVLVHGYHEDLRAIDGFEFILLDHPGDGDWSAPIATWSDTPSSLLLAGSDAQLFIMPERPPFEEVLRGALYGTPSLIYGPTHWNLLVDHDIASHSGTGFHLSPKEGPLEHLLSRFLRAWRHGEAFLRMRQWNMDTREAIYVSGRAYLTLYEELVHGSSN